LRLLIVSHSCTTPINQQVYAKLRELTGWDLTFCLPRSWKDEFGNTLHPALWPGLEAELIPIPVWPNGNIILHAYQGGLKRVLGRREFDAIYVNHEPYAVATAQFCWANRRFGRVPFGFYSCQNILKNYPPPFSWAERAVYRSSRFAFPITEAVATVLRGKGYHGNLAVCPLPFDPKIYRPLQADDIPGELKKQPGEILIGYVGRIVEAKGLRTLVTALTHLPSTGWRLVLIGSGPFEKELEELIRRNRLQERVQWLGFVPHERTPKFLAGLDLLVLPSETQPNWKEQFGRVLIEALACGIPVVGSDSGEIPNIISASGGGSIFPERDTNALATKLQEMLISERLREQYAHAGRAWALKFASLSAVAQKMAKTIEKAVDESRLSKHSSPGSSVLDPKPS